MRRYVLCAALSADGFVTTLPDLNAARTTPDERVWVHRFQMLPSNMLDTARARVPGLQIATIELDDRPKWR